MATAPGEAAKAFDKRLGRFKRTAAKLELALDQGTLSRRDLEALYEGLFIGAVVEFETFLEILFMGIMLRKTSYPGGKVAPRIHVRSHSVLVDVLHDGRRYIDWFPYSETEKRANSYLRGGRPFNALSPSQKQSVERWLWIRNAVAHSGRHARQVFEKNVIGTTPLPPRERSPAGFLRSEIRSGVTRFEHTLDEMRGIAATLCA